MMYRTLLPKSAFRNWLSIKGVLGNVFVRGSNAASRVSARPYSLLALAVVVVLGILATIL